METTRIKVIALAAILAASQLPAYSQDQANFTTSLAGKHPGLTVITRDGIPGSGSAHMMIRSIGSYAESPDVNTLKIYVDGFEVKSDYIDYLSAEEIESVEVLKAHDQQVFRIGLHLQWYQSELPHRRPAALRQR